MALILFGAVSLGVAAAAQKVILNEADFRDRVYACWLGKNIGGTLGMPFEGKREMNNVSFYTNLKKGEPAANDDLDLQILWLKAMEDNGGRVDARILGEYWLKYVPVDWNEYGVGKANMKLGWLPPLSGEYNNEKWKHSNGAWIRSEIWACLAPGYPALAARMAREDACVDHGAAEGTLAEIFTASLESAAFLEPDRDRLIAYGLSMIPDDCRVAKAVHAAIQAKKEGKDWQNARLAVIRETEDTGWFQAPRNVAFMIIGWLYGDGDFGKSISTAVNCGDDTDCTPATLGSILGIIGGTKAIPARWREPIGEKIKTVAVAGFPVPENIQALTDRTLAMTKKVLALHNAPVEVRMAPADLSGAGAILASGPKEARPLWSLSPYKIVWTETGLAVTLDYVSDPVLRPGVSRSIEMKLENRTTLEKSIRFDLQDAPKAWKIQGLPSGAVKLGKGAAQSFRLTMAAPELAPGIYAMKLSFTDKEKSFVIPLTLISPKS